MPHGHKKDAVPPDVTSAFLARTRVKGRKGLNQPLPSPFLSGKGNAFPELFLADVCLNLIEPQSRREDWEMKFYFFSKYNYTCKKAPQNRGLAVGLENE